MSFLRRMNRFITPYRTTALLALVMLIGTVLLDLAIPRLIQVVIDQGVVQRNLNVIRNLTLLMIGLTILSAVLSIGNTFLSVRVAQRVGADLRSALFQKIQTFSYPNLDRFQTGQLITRLTSDVGQLQSLVMMALRILTRAPLLMLGSFFFLITTSPELASIMLVLLAATGMIMVVFVRRTQPLFLKVQQRLDRLNEVLKENLAGVRVVKAFVRADFENKRFDEANTALTKDSIRVTRLQFTLFPTMTLLINIGTLAVIWLGGLQVSSGGETIGGILASINYLLTTLFPLGLIAIFAGQISAGYASGRRIFEVLDTQPEIRNPADPIMLGEIKGKIVFENVCFSYERDCREPVLSNISFKAEPGQTVAILGATGSGKTSLVSLIPRFYDPVSGRVLIDDRDVRTLDLDSLRSRIGIALQETVLFRGTIRDNIRYGRPEAEEEDITAAAKAAQAHDFIMSLPKGYDTIVEQRGTNLSGGQKQRIAIARALLINPSILILDDSTSAVDVETELKIQDGLRYAMAGHTKFIIAQRISTVLKADKIIVIDEGQVVAEGNHEELTKSSAIYREIYESQLGDLGEIS